MNRREFLKSAGVATFASYLPVMKKVASQNIPNIIVFFLDDLGLRDMGAYGQRDIATPNIDALAVTGQQFTNYRSGSPICSPSRYSLMTGTHAGQHPSNENQAWLRPSDITITDGVKAAGYRTAVYGKWGIGEPFSGAEPWHYGVDDYFGWMHQGLGHLSYPHFLWRNQEQVVFHGNMAHSKERTTYAPELLKDAAIEFLQSGNEPKFLLFSPNLPHANAREWNIEVPDLGQYADRPWPLAERQYAAAVTLLDSYVGELVAAAPPNTLFVVTADNGAHREGGHQPNFFGGTDGLRGHKGWIYDGGLRVPLILNWPGRLSPAVRNEAVWCPDITATIAAVAGAGMATDGASLLSSDVGNREMYFAIDDRQRGHVHSEFQQALVTPEFTAIRREFGTVELYRDEAQAVDLSGEWPAVVAHVAEVMNEYRAS